MISTVLSKALMKTNADLIRTQEHRLEREEETLRRGVSSWMLVIDRY